MDLRKGRVVGRLPRWSVACYVASYAVWITAGVAGLIRLAQSHEPGRLIISAVLASSVLGVTVGFLDLRAGRIELPSGFVEVLRQLRRR